MRKRRNPHPVEIGSWREFAATKSPGYKPGLAEVRIAYADRVWSLAG